MRLFGCIRLPLEGKALIGARLCESLHREAVPPLGKGALRFFDCACGFAQNDIGVGNALIHLLRMTQTKRPCRE